METQEVLSVIREFSNLYIGEMDDEDGYGRRFLFERDEITIEFIEGMNRIEVSFFKRLESLDTELPDYCYDEVDRYHNITCTKTISVNGKDKTRLRKALDKILCEMEYLYRKLK